MNEFLINGAVYNVLYNGIMVLAAIYLVKKIYLYPQVFNKKTIIWNDILALSNWYL